MFADSESDSDDVTDPAYERRTTTIKNKNRKNTRGKQST